MSKSDVFTVTICGGGAMLGVITSEGTKAYPNSVWYDQTRTFKNFLANEADIAQYMTPDSQRRVTRALKNQAKRETSDIIIEGARNGHFDRLTITSGKSKKLYSFNWNSQNKFQIENFTRDVLRGIEQLREQARRKESRRSS